DATSVHLPEPNPQPEIQPASEGYITVFQKTFQLEFSARAIFAEIPWNMAMVEFSVKPMSPSPQEPYLEVTVRDPCGRVLAQDGYGYRYSTATRKRIRLPGSGSYHITLYGRLIEATLCLLVNGCQDNPVAESTARTTHTFLLALKHCGLDREIESGGEYTLFVPTDEAFMRLEEEKPGFLSDISSDKKSLSHILAYHILRGKFRKEDLSVNGTHHSLLGPPPRIQKIDNRILVDDAALSLPEIECESGIIHLVDRVLIPPRNFGNGTGQSRMTGEGDLHHRDDITIILILIFLGVIIFWAFVIAFH
ncbi:MAG: fasciclin domain-containing protein, partial [Methanomicrobiaceae archaeon]|nr:fasciclin domain-containing protein [Methanomicrobiaceae archaeon]